MAKIDNIFNGGSGKLGNLVLYRMNGKNIVRTRPKKYKNQMTPGQLRSRERFKVMNAFLYKFRTAFRITLANRPAGLTALQTAQSLNLKRAVAGDYPDVYIDKTRVLLSHGPLPLPSRAWMSVCPEGLKVQWEKSREGLSTDFLVVFMVSTKKDEPGNYRLTDATRSAGEYVWKERLPFSEDALPDVWISFCNTGMTQWSDTMWVEKSS